MTKNINSIKKIIDIPVLLISFFLTNAVLLFVNRETEYQTKEYLENINPFMAAAIFLSAYFILSSVYMRFEINSRAKSIVLLVSTWIYFFMMCHFGGDIFVAFGGLAVIAMVILYVVSIDSGLPGIKSNKLEIILWVLFSGISVFIGSITVVRYLNFSSPCFDFGIFTQMFEYMRTTGVPYTTCERDELLSHFAVHVSPAYYLILPFYALFPFPHTIQIAQAVIVAAGIFPLYKLCRLKNLPNIMTLFILITYSFYPALSGGCMYDIHENMFLTVFLLWLFYYLEKADESFKSWVGVFVFAVLVFTVKEDAPIYVAVISLYVMFGKKNFEQGLLLLLFSISYFLFALWLLETYGTGVMTGSRYGVYAEDGSLSVVIQTILINPAFIIKESITQEKIMYIMRMFLPLSFIPLINKKPAGLILFIPFILLNLMPDWVYHQRIDFQYNFGNCAIFFYLFVMNISEFKSMKLKKFVLIFSMTASIFLFSTEMWKRTNIFEDYSKNSEKNAIIREVLNEIPSDKSVSASTFFVASLYKSQELYQLNTHGERTTDYIAVDMRYLENRELPQQYEARGYRIVTNHENLITVLIKEES